MSDTLSVVIEKEMPYKPEKVWRALTQPHLIAEWLMKNDFEPRVGHKFQLDPKPQWDGIIDCEVLEIEANKKLTYSWGTLGLNTLVTFTLTPTKNGVMLRVEQSGFSPDRPQNYQGAKYGWQNFLGKLERVAENA